MIILRAQEVEEVAFMYSSSFQFLVQLCEVEAGVAVFRSVFGGIVPVFFDFHHQADAFFIAFRPEEKIGIKFLLLLILYV